MDLGVGFWATGACDFEVAVMQAFTRKSFYVVGLARTGCSAVDFLLGCGARVYVWDDDPKALANLQLGRAELVVIDPQSLYDRGDYQALQGVLLSPGIGDTHLSALLAVRCGVPLISDISVFAAAFSQARPIAVTGTNGKSTVCLLVAHILNHCGVSARAAGNIGEPILSADSIAAESQSTFVLELSSYQIERLGSPREHATTLTCGVAVLLNIAPDHLERHASMQNYAAIKQSLYKFLATDGVAVVGVDDAYCVDIYNALLGRDKSVIAISGRQYLTHGIGVRDGWLWDGFGNEGIIDLACLPLLAGVHNAQNLAASYAAIAGYGLPLDSVRSALLTFMPLPHRQQRLGQWRNLCFINDSKATNIAAGKPAFEAYDNIYWLAGGILKESDFSVLYPYSERLRGAYFFGRDRAVLEASFSDRVACASFEDMSSAFAMACSDAESGGESSIILLCPLSASFDQFSDFVERGESFAGLVRDFIAGRGV